MNEKKLEQLLSLEENGEDEMKKEDNAGENGDISLAKKLKKSLQSQINKRVFRTIFLMILGTALFLFLVSVSFDYLYYNPKEASRYIEAGESDDYTYSDFHFLMDIYTGLHYTGKRYYQLEERSEKEGFGSYKMYAKIQDVFEPLHIDGKYNTVFEIKRNRLSVENLSDEYPLARYINDFYNDSESDIYDYVSDLLDVDEDVIDEVEKLPESAVIYATISFEESLSLEDTLDFIRKYPESEFRWIAMDSDVQFLGGSFDGISLSAAIGYPLTDEADALYPNLLLNHLDEDITADQLAQCYLSRLKIMYDNPEFLKIVERESNSYAYPSRRKMEQLEDRFAEIEEKGLWAIGLYGRIAKEDFLVMVETGEIPYANIKDAKLSVLSK